ncbi:calcium activated cation channel [Flagelloscypha sp. PMI_526]|nr:calcium activated cation channel [Flagelloscypha sp. PMI_526]
MARADNDDPGLVEDNVSVSSIVSVEADPDVINKLVNRIRIPTSRIICAPVIAAFRDAAGDFVQALPYALLRARAEFMYDANHNAADYDENYGRAIACEVLARRIVHFAPAESLNSLLSTRFRHRQIDGDISGYANCLEMAIDSNSTIFLSSSEAQDVVLALWKGDLIQKNNPDHDIEYTIYEDSHHKRTFWDHVNPNRLSVPRYQNMFRIIVWLVLLFVFSQAVQSPVDDINDPSAPMSPWEIALYLLGFSLGVEDLHTLYKLLSLFSWRLFSFWTLVNLMTDSLLLSAFIVRVIGLLVDGIDLRTRSFQILSFVGPLLWMKLIRIFDGYKYVGTMQICIARMLRESGIFFALLSILALGFYQGLYALDLADGVADTPVVVVNLLVQALLGDPSFDKFAESSAGLWLYYLWNVVTAVILLNVLISLFSSAYEDVVDDAEGEYLAFFAEKTVGMIRAPDSYVYPAPFNLIEAFFIAPFEPCVSHQTYAIINNYVMTTIFFVPLLFLALYESTLHQKVQPWLSGDDQGGPQISTVKFDDIVQRFPDTRVSPEGVIVKEVRSLRQEIAELKALLSGQRDSPNLKQEGA